MSILKNKQNIEQNIVRLEQMITKRTSPVNVIAVTKYVGLPEAEQLLEAGITHIGENRVDQFLEKYTIFKGRNVQWHLIGTLQRRKVKDVINFVDYFHALDSVKLAEEIQKRANHKIKCFLQINISNEASKHGIAVSDIEEVIAKLVYLDKVELVGIMTMAPLHATEKELDDLFSKANQLRKKLQSLEIPNMPFTELSMGMSNDYAVAIKNGATFVRIGSAFFK